MRLGLLLSLFLIGCANSTNKCGDKVLLLWPKDGQYKFQEIQLNSLKSPYELRGSAAEIYFESGLNDSGFQGEIARPNLTRSGDVCVPTDTGSALALTAYAQFERLQEFERALGVADQLSWPRKVGVEIHLRGDPTDTHNNAHYYGQQDVIALVPYDKSNMPVTLNHGIVAHEHFHSHFQSQVIAFVNQAMPLIISLEDVFYPEALRFKPTVEDLENTDRRSPRGLNNFVMRGWNEGLADFFAGVYTGQPDFFASSLPGSLQQRRLDLPLGPLATGPTYQAVASQFVGPHGEPSARALVGLAYGQGALLARLLYALSNSGMLSPREFLSTVVKNIRKLPEQVVPGYARTVMDTDFILPVILQGLPLNAEACSYLNQTVSKNTLVKGFPQCANM